MVGENPKICLQYNHIEGRGCNAGRDCPYEGHFCAGCGASDHGVYFTDNNGCLVCPGIGPFCTQLKEMVGDRNSSLRNPVQFLAAIGVKKQEEEQATTSTSTSSSTITSINNNKTFNDNTNFNNNTTINNKSVSKHRGKFVKQPAQQWYGDAAEEEGA